MNEQPFGVRLAFGVGVLLLIPAIAYGGLALRGALEADLPPPLAPTVMASATASPRDLASAATPTATPGLTASRAPSPTPTQTVEPTPVPTPTALAPLVPYDGTPPTTEAEVRAVYDRMVVEAGKIGEQPDPRKIDALYATECRCFQPFRDDIEGRQERGEYGQGEPAEVRSFELRFAETEPEPRWSVRVLIQIDKNGKTFAPDGTVVDDGSDAGPEDLIVSAVARDGAWYFTQVDRIVG